MSEPVLRLRDVAVEYHRRGRGLAGRSVNRAVDGVSLDVQPGETFGLVGESGSGKSTTGRAALGLVPVADGAVTLDGHDLAGTSRRRRRELSSRAQLVFQDPYSSLDPSMTVGQSLAEPLRIHSRGGSAQRRRAVERALVSVGLSPAHAQRYPQEFSGGQRQRICIARGMILDPKLVILDEPVSALDVSTQGQVMNLLVDLQREHGTAFLFIAHDLTLVRNVSHRMAVMYLGQIVDEGPAERVWTSPGHPYTAALMSAIPEPRIGSRKKRERILVSGEVPSAWDPPSGCRFHTRCPLVMDVCRDVVPPPLPMVGGGTAACHLHSEGPELRGRTVTDLLR